ncbi:nucleotidyltransferase domain-containing protein [Candidatus Margulisiibacteriota bacterium]
MAYNQSMTEKEIEKIKSIIKNQKDVILAYIYGSQAKGKARKNSDTDIAVLLDEKKSPPTPYGRDVNLAGKIEKPTKLNIDLRILNNSSPFFAFQVIKHGKVLYSADENRRVEFESRARCKYFDLKPMYKMFFRDMNNRIDRGEYGARS